MTLPEALQKSPRCAELLAILGPEPIRFATLARSAGGLSHKTLAAILRNLERDGIVQRQAFATIPPRVEYSLTRSGEALREIVGQMARWSATHDQAIQAARLAYSMRQTAIGREG